MILSRALKIGLVVLLVAIPIARLSVQGHEEQTVWPRGQLTAQEESLAQQLAERELQKPEHNIGLAEKIYFTSLQLLPDSQAETMQREVLVVHYRYQGNQAILSYVDLNTQTVYKVEKVNNLPTALADEELRLAKELARADTRLTALFAEFGDALHIEGKLSWPAEVEDVTKPHRNVQLLFRVGRDYLAEPMVTVDLVTETVDVKQPLPRS